MKKFLFILLLILGKFAFAQDPEILLYVNTGNDDTNKKMGGVTVEIFQDGKKIKTVVSPSNGKVPPIYLPIGHVYLIKFKKSGFVTKMAELDGRYDTPEDLDPEVVSQMPVFLFESADGIDFSFLEREPMAKFAMSADGYSFEMDRPYTEAMQKKIKELKKKIEEKKEENAEEEEKMKQLEADFQAYVDAGDKAMSKKEYKTAIEQYELALGIKKDDAAVKTKLADAKKKLAELEGAAQKEKDYQAKMVEANNAFDGKTYDQALKLYNEASQIKPNEQKPKNQIAAIKKLLEEQKAKEEEFKKFVEQGDAAMSSKTYENAISKYESALAIKQDATVQAKLDDAKKKKKEKEDAEKADQEKEAKYIALINSADKFFEAEKWDDAIAKYQEALTVKANEPHPTNRIKEINEKLKEQNEAAELQKKYDAAIKKADDLFASNKYTEAKTAYQNALSIKSDEQKPKDQIQKIEDILSQQASQEEAFNKLVDQGDVAVNSELFDDAILKYEEALKIKDDSDVKTKIENAKKLRDEKTAAANAEKDKEEKYQTAISEADKLFDSNSWTDAIAKYNKALSIKPSEAHPTNRIKEINQKIEDEKAKNAAAQKLEEDYNNLIAEGQSLFEADKLEEAKTKYQDALKLKPGEAVPTNKIDEINNLLAKQGAEKKKKEAYQAELDKATELYKQKKYEEALSSFNKASGIKPNEQEPKDQIIAINKILNDQKNANQLEEEYQAFMKEGGGLLANNDLTTALDRYKKAIGVKVGDAAAQSKIDEIENRIKEEQDAKKKEEEFATLVAKGNTSFNAQNYQDAKLKYQKALGIKSDSEIEQKIKDIDKLIAENESASELKAKFDAALKEADDLFKANEYEKAKPKYEAANSIQESQYAIDQIAIINKKITEQNEQAEKEKQYNELISQATQLEADKKYQLALDKLKEAYGLRPTTELSEKMRVLTTLIAEENQNKSKEQAYKDKITQADAKFTEGDWKQAKEYYTQAKPFNPSESYPDDQIALCDKKMQEESIAEIEKNYQKLITKADGLRDSKSYDEAISYYKRALGFKPNDQYPKDQISAINKIKNDQANAENDATRLEKEYNDLVKSADDLYNAKNYTAALDKYKEAYAKRPTDSYVNGRIEDIKTKLANQTVANSANTEYDKLITEADALMKPGTWQDAKIKYEQALKIKEESYPKDQISKAIEMMKKESEGEIEAQYQKILTVAQKKMDAEDYKKALELYNRAIGMRPSDPKPQQKIDEINQILNNKKVNGDYNSIIQKADNLFEQNKWKQARELYVKAYNMRNEKYPDDQIKKIDAQLSDANRSQYNKIISKADEYFDAKNYEKSKGLYVRAMKLFPSIDKTYPTDQLDKIKAILNPPMAVNNGVRNLGDPVVGMTEDKIALMLDDAEKQRKHNEVLKVTNANDEMASYKNEWSENELKATNEAKVTTTQMKEDISKVSWEAEIQREKAEQATQQQTEDYNNAQREIAIYSEHAIFKQKEVVENMREEMSENKANADIPRLEFEKEVVEIQTDINTENSLNTNAQTNEIFDTRNDVIRQKEEHVTADPNMDVARKNTEVKVVDMKVRIVNENSENAWNQEDENYKTKENVNLMLDEQKAAKVNSDIPRQDMEDKVVDINENNSDYSSELKRDQANVVYDVKSYTDKAKEEIQIANIENDIPRQKMEIKKTKIEEEIANQNMAYTTSQKSATNDSKDYVEDEKEIQANVFNQKDKEREDDAENVILIKDEIKQEQENLVADNKDVSYSTKDYVDEQQVKNADLKEEGDIKTKQNQDKTANVVQDLNDNRTQNQEENQKAVDETTDYITKMKDLDVTKIDIHVKNKLGEEFPEGVTEEIYEMKDSNGLLTGYVVRRLVVIEGEGNVYEKTQTRYGTVSYTKNGEGISQTQWQEETKNANLVYH